MSTRLAGREAQPHRADLHLRHLEHLRDQAQQLLAALEDGVGVLGLLFVERPSDALGEHLGEPDDARQRRAQLVADRGQEVALELVDLAQVGDRPLELGVALLQRPWLLSLAARCISEVTQVANPACSTAPSTPRARRRDRPGARSRRGPGIETTKLPTRSAPAKQGRTANWCSSRPKWPRSRCGPTQGVEGLGRELVPVLHRAVADGRIADPVVVKHGHAVDGAESAARHGASARVRSSWRTRRSSGGRRSGAPTASMSSRFSTITADLPGTARRPGP